MTRYRSERDEIADSNWRRDASRLGLDPSGSRLDAFRLIERRRQLRAIRARKNPSKFCEYVLRDEQTLKPFDQAPMHEEWHRILSNSENDRVVFFSHVEAGKTNQISIGRALWELGVNPSLRIAIISNTNDLAKKITRQIGQYIKKSVELHEVFPHLVPTDDPALQWRAQALTVKRPGMGGKDPSIQAAGMHGNIIGSRIDLLILDDVLDTENTRTLAPRNDAYQWLKSIGGRMTANGRIWCVGNAWHPDDAYHRFEKEGYYTKRYPVMDPVTGELTWPERWSPARIEKAKGPSGLGPFEFARQLMCQARDDASARFKREWIEVGIEKGRGVPFVESIDEVYTEELFIEAFSAEEAAGNDNVEEKRRALAVQRALGTCVGGDFVFTGVDLAVQRKDSSDETALFTILVDKKTKTRRILNVRAGKWSGPDIVRRIQEVYEQFGSIIMVENNAAQDYIRQFTIEQTAIPIVPFTTGRNKADPAFGVESLATELANGKWIIPNSKSKTGKPVMHKEVQKTIEELLYFDAKEHTGDRLMAMWMAREASRRFAERSSQGSLSVRTF